MPARIMDPRAAPETRKTVQNRRPSVSVIIPTLDEERLIGKTLRAIRSLELDEVIVSDGGSSDATLAIARRHNCRIVTSSSGRGQQLAAGANAATGDLLWFVHADTEPPPDAAEQIEEALAKPAVVGGHFRVAFDGAKSPARAFARIYRAAQYFGLCYGDSAYFVRREAYDAVGGFRSLPLFEDLDLRNRLTRVGRFVAVPASVTTSGRRFAGRNAAMMLLQWSALQVLYWLGVSPATLAQFYATVRGPERAEFDVLTDSRSTILFKSLLKLRADREP